MIANLHSKPPKQEAWHKQVSKNMNKSQRIIDTMSQGEIYQMYKNKEFVCDDCGKQIPNVHLIPIEQHMIHLIDPTCHWVCETCTDDDLENDKVIAMDLS